MPHFHCLDQNATTHNMKRRISLCVFGVEKFNAYMFGHPFDLITNHKPLLSLLSEYKASFPQASSHMKQWSLFLSSYEYTMIFHVTQSQANADALADYR